MQDKLRNKQFFLFLCSGSIAAGVNFGSRLLYSKWMPFSWALIFAYLTGMVTAFILAKRFVFKNTKQSLSKSVWRFCLVNVAAICQTWCMSMALANWLFPFLGITQHAQILAHGIGISLPIFTSYVGHKRWSFRTSL